MAAHVASVQELLGSLLLARISVKAYVHDHASVRSTRPVRARGARADDCDGERVVPVSNDGCGAAVVLLSQSGTGEEGRAPERSTAGQGRVLLRRRARGGTRH